jgi:hypothetical protein
VPLSSSIIIIFPKYTQERVITHKARDYIELYTRRQVRGKNEL